MFSLAGQTVEPNGLNFFVDTLGGWGVLKAKIFEFKKRRIFFNIRKILKS